MFALLLLLLLLLRTSVVGIWQQRAFAPCLPPISGGCLARDWPISGGRPGLAGDLVASLVGPVMLVLNVCTRPERPVPIGESR
ncbi:hypothetical protein PEC18_33935 [Paucibacter sp. O1-1]|nr:hypothetical protein [Paucibacter sp. O1-1]MDA3830693.1 hypothetical protein [Paucibacter sp. O1-1]